MTIHGSTRGNETRKRRRRQPDQSKAAGACLAIVAAGVVLLQARGFTTASDIQTPRTSTTCSTDRSACPAATNVPGLLGNTLQRGSGGDVGACRGDLSARPVEMDVTTPPYTWSIAMLSGRDLQPGCPRNEHVAHAGARILDWRYERTPSESRGTLIDTVKMDFGDDGDFPGMREHVQVDVLGIDPIEPTVVR